MKVCNVPGIHFIRLSALVLGLCILSAPTSFGSSPIFLDSVPNLKVIGHGIIQDAEDYTRAIKIRPGEIGAYFMNGSERLLTYFGYDDSDMTGLIETYGVSSLNTRMGHVPGHPERGQLGVFDGAGMMLSSMAVNEDSAGIITTYGPNGTRNTVSSSTGASAYHGYYGAFNNTDVAVASLWSDPDGGNLSLSSNSGDVSLVGDISDTGLGSLYTFGPNGNMNTVLGSSPSSQDRGRIGIYDENGVVQAGMYIDSMGNGVLFADLKPFVIDHPKDEGKEIWYVCLEGPEAGAYDRGTATLQDGVAFIPYSDDFSIVVIPSSVTVQLTPHTIDTYGLAVGEKTGNGFYVHEVMGGKGNFGFDWEVKGKRKGFEYFKVIRNKGEGDNPLERRTSTVNSN